jgi:hypothetical protein
MDAAHQATKIILSESIYHPTLGFKPSTDQSVICYTSKKVYEHWCDNYHRIAQTSDTNEQWFHAKTMFPYMDSGINWVAIKNVLNASQKKIDKNATKILKDITLEFYKNNKTEVSYLLPRHIEDNFQSLLVSRYKESNKKWYKIVCVDMVHHNVDWKDIADAVNEIL